MCYVQLMAQKTVAIDADLHARVKSVTKREAMKIGALTERLLRDWLMRIDRPKRKKAG